MTTTFRICSQRLWLEPPKEQDAACIVRLIDNPRIAWNLARVPSPYAIEDARAWIEHCAADRRDGREYAFLIHHVEHGIVGSAGVHPVLDDVWEIGYWIGEPYWGQGFATEAGEAVLNWAEEELGAEGFVAGHFTDNPASGRVLERLGFRSAGVTDYPGLARGGMFPAMRYCRNADPALALAPGSRHAVETE